MLMLIFAGLFLGAILFLLGILCGNLPTVLVGAFVFFLACSATGSGAPDKEETNRLIPESQQAQPISKC